MTHFCGHCIVWRLEIWFLKPTHVYIVCSTTGLICKIIIIIITGVVVVYVIIFTCRQRATSKINLKYWNG